MNILLIGGAGYVARLVLPQLKQDHSLCVFDRRQPADKTVRFVRGNVTSYDALTNAMADMDAVIFMAMGPPVWDEPIGFNAAFDVNVKGLHLALRAANACGVRHAVYTSSMSVYEGRLDERRFDTEDIHPDQTKVYGFTKWLGEEVCRNAARLWGISVNALRLCWPVADERLHEERALRRSILPTAASDLARALTSALTFRDGFQVFNISGDHENRVMNMEKARRLLRWQPEAE